MPYHFQEMHLFHEFLDIFIALITNSVHLTRIPNAKKSNLAKNKTSKTRLKVNRSRSWALWQQNSDFGILSFFWFPPNYSKTYFLVYVHFYFVYIFLPLMWEEHRPTLGTSGHGLESYLKLIFSHLWQKRLNCTLQNSRFFPQNRFSVA